MPTFIDEFVIYLLLPIFAQIMPSTVPVNSALAADFVAGSRKAFGKIYIRYAPALLGFISKIVTDKKAAEDILQKSFLAMWDNRHSLGSQPLFVWMLGITRHTVRSFVDTDAEKEIQKALSYVNTYKTPGSNGVSTDNKGLQAAVFELVYFNGYSVDEVAAKLNIEKENMKILLRNAIGNLKTPSNE